MLSFAADESENNSNPVVILNDKNIQQNVSISQAFIINLHNPIRRQIKNFAARISFVLSSMTCVLFF